MHQVFLDGNFQLKRYNILKIADHFFNVVLTFGNGQSLASFMLIFFHFKHQCNFTTNKCEK